MSLFLFVRGEIKVSKVYGTKQNILYCHHVGMFKLRREELRCTYLELRRVGGREK
jgi:hypothetical protein